jgi:hypothetical protein
VEEIGGEGTALPPGTALRGEILKGLPGQRVLIFFIREAL